MNIQFSRWLAIIGGVLAPLFETVRLWSTWQQSPANLFDDYIMGAFLLYAAWRTGKHVQSGQRYLASAWAFACGLGYYSFFGRLLSVFAILYNKDRPFGLLIALTGAKPNFVLCGMSNLLRTHTLSNCVKQKPNSILI